MSSPLLVQMAGHAGSGKSTLACEVAKRFGGVAIDLDVVKTALLEAGLGWDLASSTSYQTIFAFAEDLLRAGNPCVVVDTPSYWPEIYQRLTSVARDSEASYLFVECVTDEATRAQRLADRPAKRSQIQLLGVEPIDAPAQSSSTHSRPIARPASGRCLTVDTGTSFDLETSLSEISSRLMESRRSSLVADDPAAACS